MSRFVRNYKIKNIGSKRLTLFECDNHDSCRWNVDHQRSEAKNNQKRAVKSDDVGGVSMVSAGAKKKKNATN